MTSADADENDDNDEGIEDGEEIRQSGQCGEVLELCRLHLATKAEAESHYRAVCRALVAEALEISTFMEKMGNGENEDLSELAMDDWANIWSDVMGELRTGIKLKKVSFSKTPSEFGLTPYEMLMSDIRKQSVKLNPTKIPPKVKTDAKDIILEFIRSRPPLRKASNRKLKPRVKKTTPMEDLMEEIRSIDASKRLRKTNFPANNRQTLALPASSNGKKSISPDESFFDDILNFEDEEEEDSEDVPSLPTPPRKPQPREVTRASPRLVNNNNKELRRPFSGCQPSTKPPPVSPE